VVADVTQLLVSGRSGPHSACFSADQFAMIPALGAIHVRQFGRSCCWVCWRCSERMAKCLTVSTRSSSHWMQDLPSRIFFSGARFHLVQAWRPLDREEEAEASPQQFTQSPLKHHSCTAGSMAAWRRTPASSTAIPFSGMALYRSELKSAGVGLLRCYCGPYSCAKRPASSAAWKTRRQYSITVYMSGTCRLVQVPSPAARSHQIKRGVCMFMGKTGFYTWDTCNHKHWSLAYHTGMRYGTVQRMGLFCSAPMVY